MASVVKKDEDENKVMAGESPEDREEQDDRESPDDADREESEAEDRDERKASQQPAQRAESKTSEPGFFTIRKRGQGYWTRMGTVAAAALIGFATVQFLYSQLPAWLPDAWNAGSGMPFAKKLTLGVCAGFLAAYALIVYWILNKPTNVDFLIATDSEMKKVNWTSRSELIGSTKVVIVFMFLIAAILFVIDLFFGYVFYLLGVLKTKPF